MTMTAPRKHNYPAERSTPSNADLANYTDTGCVEYGGCERSLECPFPQCVLETTRQRACETLKDEARERRRRALELRETTTLSIDAIAAIIGVTPRTIFRLLAGRDE